MDKCVLCQGQESVLIQVGVRHAPHVEVRHCTNCDLVFLLPRPSEEELDSYYREVYRDDYAEPPVQERYRADLDEARTRVRRLLHLLNPGTRLLEVGSGSGAFLDAVRPYVGEAVGVEPDISSRDWISKELGLHVDEQITDVARGGKSFDIVASFHVLEHILDPVRFLQNLARLLKPGAKLVLEVPNIDDALVTVYRIPAYLPFYYQKAHLYYFSKYTLARTIEKAGFHANIEGIQRYDLSNHVRWMLTGQPGGQGYYKEIFLSSLNTAYAEALERAGHSDTLWAVAQANG